MRNFTYQSLRNTIEPLAFFADPSERRFALVRLWAGDIPAALAAVQGIWERVLPRYPFDYQFLDEDFDGMYRSEERISTLLGYFAVFAVVIACLGLFGLALVYSGTTHQGDRSSEGAGAIAAASGRTALQRIFCTGRSFWPAFWLVLPPILL